MLACIASTQSTLGTAMETVQNKLFGEGVISFAEYISLSALTNPLEKVTDLIKKLSTKSREAFALLANILEAEHLTPDLVKKLREELQRQPEEGEFMIFYVFS